MGCVLSLWMEAKKWRTASADVQIGPFLSVYINLHLAPSWINFFLLNPFVVRSFCEQIKKKTIQRCPECLL